MISLPRYKNLIPTLVAFSPLVLYAGLYLLRHLDDNRLTSWQWAFESASVPGVFGALFIMSIVSLFISKQEFISVNFISAIAFGLGMAFWHEPEVIVDASRYFTQAKHLSQYGIGYFLSQWGGAIEPWTDMPLVPFIYGLGFSALGESRWVAQLLTTCAFAGSVWLASRSSLELFSKEDEGDIGVLTGAFLLSMPYLYTQVPLMMVDVFSMFFLILGFFTLQRALDRGGWIWLISASISIFLMLITKYSQWMMASVYIMLFLVKLKANPRPVIKRGVLVALLAGVFFVSFLLNYQDVVKAQMELLVSYQRPGLRRWGESFFSTFFFQIHPFLTLSALASVFVALRKKDLRWVIAAWLVLLTLVLQIERSRYIIPLLPMFAMMGAYGLNSLNSARIKRLVAIICITGSFVIASGVFLPYLKTNNLINLMKAGEFLNQQNAVLVQASAMPQKSEINPAVAVPLLDLYTEAPIEYFYDLLPLLPKDKIAVSPFRFTWTYRNPGYYDYRAERKPSHIAVVSFWEQERIAGRIPLGFEFIKRYDISEGRYRFKPYVSIYESKEE